MNDITREQAAQIFDLDSYKEVTGAKRFKRTKEEMQLGLTPERALQRRLENLRGPQSKQKDDGEQRVQGRNQTRSKGPRPSTSRKGDIILHIRPAAGTDVDYFEQIPDGPVELVLNENWFSWFDNRMGVPYNGDSTKLLRHIIEMGMGEVITKIHFEDDLAEHERLTDYSTIQRPDEL